jgi:type II secretory pathway pseudopilin PulG
MRRNKFTLVEIIAVLLIISIMAAVAAPKFLSLATEARKGMAQTGINEAKATLSVGYAKAYLASGGVGTITGGDVVGEAFPTLLTGGSVQFGDIPVTFTFGATAAVTLSATYEAETATGSWSVPTHEITNP